MVKQLELIHHLDIGGLNLGQLCPGFAGISITNCTESELCLSVPFNSQLKHNYETIPLRVSD